MFFCVPGSVAEGSIISLVAIIPMSITLNQILKRYRNLDQGTSRRLQAKFAAAWMWKAFWVSALARNPAKLLDGV